VSCACRAHPLQEQQAESVLIAWHLEAYPSICAAGCSASTLARMLPRRASPVLLSKLMYTYWAARTLILSNRRDKRGPKVPWHQMALLPFGHPISSQCQVVHSSHLRYDLCEVAQQNSR
jgi:hypothetical protein